MTARETTTKGGRRQKLGGLVRVSRVAGRDDKLRSPDQQTAAIERFAETEAAIVDEVVVLLDVSGSKVDEDAELDRLIGRVEDGELDGIVVAKLDRLSRLAPRRRLDLLERLGEDRLFSATESNDVSTPEGRMVRELFFLLARMEWEKKRDDLALAKANAIERGVKLSTVAPFGYRFAAGRVLEVVAGEAAIVVEMFELRAAGASFGDVLDLFEARTGRSSSRQTIAELLRNEAYLGRVVYGRRDDTRLERDGAHEAIVDVDLFDRVQAVGVERGWSEERRGGAGGRPTSRFGGIATCAACGAGLGRTTSNGGATSSYRCTNPKCSSRASIGEAALDDYVIATILEELGEAADVDVEVELDAIGDRVVLEHRLGEAKASRLAWSADVERELADPAGYKAGLEARDGLVSKLERALEELGEASELEVAHSTLREALLGETELELEELRRLLRVALDSVVVRRTPRRGAPASERVEVLLASSADGASSEDARELVAKAAA